VTIRTGDDIPADFVRDFGALMEDETTVEVHFTRYAMWCLMSAVQLAARHPEAIKMDAIRTAVELARNLQDCLSRTPALARIAEQGWDVSDAYHHSVEAATMTRDIPLTRHARNVGVVVAKRAFEARHERGHADNAEGEQAFSLSDLGYIIAEAVDIGADVLARMADRLPKGHA
jgi:hypothetical protein